MNYIEIAIKRENDGENFYLEQAEANKDNALSTVFLSLAKDEANHALILENKAKELAFDFQEKETHSSSKAIFQNIKSKDMNIPLMLKQVEAYKIGLEKEKQSIEVYEILLSEAKDDKTKKMFEYLLKQEKEHFSVIEEMIILMNRTDDWVESPEFGVREEY